jgi:hypothetical protein
MGGEVSGRTSGPLVNASAPNRVGNTRNDDVPAMNKFLANRGAAHGVDVTTVRTDQFIDPWWSELGGQYFEEAGLALMLQAIGAANPEDIPFEKGVRLGQPSQMLDEALAGGGSPQLQAYRQVRHAMNETIAYEYFAEQGKTPTQEELQKMVQALDDLVAIEIMSSLHNAQAAGTLGSQDHQISIMYAGIDLQRELKVTGEAVRLIPTAADLAAMSDLECTELVNKMLGDDGGGAAIATRRAALAHDAKALADFDRGLLTTLLTTKQAVINDPAYAKELGIDPSGRIEIPPEFRGSLMMMIAYMFAKMDERLTSELKDMVEDYSANNDAYAETGGDDDGHDPAQANSLNQAQMFIKVKVEAIAQNSSMGGGIINSLAESSKSIWR